MARALASALRFLAFFGGLTLIVIGSGLVYLPAGLVVAGLVLLLAVWFEWRFERARSEPRAGP